MAQRTVVRAIQAKFQLSERRACALVGLGRSKRPSREWWRFWPWMASSGSVLMFVLFDRTAVVLTFWSL